MRKREAMEQQVEVVPKTSATMKKVWRSKQVVSHRLEQNMADNCFSPLVQKMADVVLIITLDNFGTKEYFLASKLYQKIGGHMLTAKIVTNRSDRSRHCGLSGRDRPV